MTSSVENFLIVNALISSTNIEWDAISQALPEGYSRKICDYSPLQRAILLQKVEECRELLEAGSLPNERGMAEVTPLKLSLLLKNEEIALLLAKAGADIHKPDEYNRPIWIQAVQLGFLDFMTHCVTSRSIDLQGTFIGIKWLSYLCISDDVPVDTKNFYQILELLIREGAPLSPVFADPVAYLESEKITDPERVKKVQNAPSHLLKYILLSTRKKLFKPLFIASSEEDRNWRHHSGESLLHNCVVHYPQKIGLLLDHGLSARAVNSKGDTPLLIGKRQNLSPPLLKRLELADGGFTKAHLAYQKFLYMTNFEDPSRKNLFSDDEIFERVKDLFVKFAKKCDYPHLETALETLNWVDSGFFDRIRRYNENQPLLIRYKTSAALFYKNLEANINPDNFGIYRVEKRDVYSFLSPEGVDPDYKSSYFNSMILGLPTWYNSLERNIISTLMLLLQLDQNSEVTFQDIENLMVDDPFIKEYQELMDENALKKLQDASDSPFQIVDQKAPRYLLSKLYETSEKTLKGLLKMYPWLSTWKGEVEETLMHKFGRNPEAIDHLLDIGLSPKNYTNTKRPVTPLVVAAESWREKRPDVWARLWNADSFFTSYHQAKRILNNAIQFDSNLMGYQSSTNDFEILANLAFIDYVNSPDCELLNPEFICQMLSDTSNMDSLKQRYANHEPILISTGYPGHSNKTILYRNILVKIDTAKGASGISIYNCHCEEAVINRVIEKLVNYKKISHGNLTPHHSRYYYMGLDEELDLNLIGQLGVEQQVENCPFYSMKHALIPCMMLSLLDFSRVDKNEMQKVLNEITPEFRKWSDYYLKHIIIYYAKARWSYQEPNRLEFFQCTPMFAHLLNHIFENDYHRSLQELNRHFPLFSPAQPPLNPLIPAEWHNGYHSITDLARHYNAQGCFQFLEWEKMRVYNEVMAAQAPSLQKGLMISS